MRHLIAMALILLLNGCGLLFSAYEEKPYEEVMVFPSDAYGSYALQIAFHVTRRGGNVHDFNDLSKTEENRADWLYLNSLEGRVNADAIVYKLFRGDTLLRPLRGSVEFSNGSIMINLQTPIYKDGKLTNHWAPYKFNGIYRLKLAPNNLH